MERVEPRAAQKRAALDGAVTYTAMEPLRIVARLSGAISLPSSSIAIDGLLASATATRDNLPPISMQLASGTYKQLEIPIQREPGQRFHMASFAKPCCNEHERLYLHRRFPLQEALTLTNQKVVNISSGAEKSYRVPYTASFVAGNALEWWCIGNAEQIRKLLAWVSYLGAHRKCGSGKVVEWTVEPCMPWEGFPVVREGRAMRPLPVDWPGLVDPATEMIPITYPYFRKEVSEICAVG